MHRSLWLYDTDTRSARQVTSGMFDDSYPGFDPAGNYLFFISTRNYSAPTFTPEAATSYTRMKIL